MTIERAIRTMKKKNDPAPGFRSVCVRYFMPFLIFIGIQLSAAAQKYDQKKGSDMVTKDGVDYVRIEEKGCGFGQLCSFNIYDKDGTKVIIVTIDSFKDPAAVSQTNADGGVGFTTYIFPTLGTKAEYAYVRLKAHKLAKDIDSNDLIKDGMLNEEAVNEFILVNGMKFSERRDGIIRVISR